MTRRRGKVVSLAVAVGTVLFLGGSGYVLRNALVDWWYRIPVARTWRHLLVQRPIQLGEGAQVRVAIEADRCPQGGGVLVYCLTEGYDPSSRDLGDMRGRLGPLRVVVTEEGSPGHAQRLGEIQRNLSEYDQSDSSPSHLLFVKPVAFSRPGTFHVRLLSGGEELRRATVVATPSVLPPWTAFSRPRRLLKMRRSPFPVVRVMIAGGGVALPRWDGWRPYAPVATRQYLTDPDVPLPRLQPEDTEQSLRLEFLDGGLNLTSREEMVTSRPVDHFLARWWINGEPYCPAAIQETMAESYSGRETTGTDLRLELEFDPARFGAKKGDRVGVQLLYVDQGWEYVSDGLAMARLARLDGRHRTLLSNRVEFLAP